MIFNLNLNKTEKEGQMKNSETLEKIDSGKTSLSRQLLEEWVELATKAPSGHNTQPWKFSIEERSITIYPDYKRSLPVVDADNHALFISLGCAIENIVIAANHKGFMSNILNFPKDAKEECIRISFQEMNCCEWDPLYEMIRQRQSTRCLYDGKPIPEAHLEQLQEAAQQEDVECIFITDKKDFEPLIGFIKEGNLLQFSNKAFVNELISWIRFSKRDAYEKADGLNAQSMGMPFIPQWLGKWILNYLVSGRSEARKWEKLIRSSSALVLFVAQQHHKKNWLHLGRSFQRMALTASQLGIKLAHVNMPCEELKVRKKLVWHYQLGEKQPLLLVRLGYAKAMPPAMRRPLSEVLLNG